MASTSPPVHRYNSLLPPAVSPAAVSNEASSLRLSIAAGFKSALANDGAPDTLEAIRQLKRLNALTALKFELPDEEWARIVASLLELTLTCGVDLPRQTSFMNALSRLLRKKRDPTLLVIPWRPLWTLYQTRYLSHASPRARASGRVISSHAAALVHLIRKASWYFPPSAAGEIVAVASLSLVHLQTHAPFTAQAFLWLFLPNTTRLADLPPGTAEHWLRVWSWVDNCSQWDAVWASLFARLAHPGRMGSTDASGRWSSPLEWGKYAPFLAARMQSVLDVHVGERHPTRKSYPADAEALLADMAPNAIDCMCKLLVRLLTVEVPPGLAATFGDAPQPPSSSTSASAALSTAVGDASVMGFIERQLRALSTMFYPTNTNAHTFLGFLRALTSRLTKRAGRETGAVQASLLTGGGGRISPSSPPPLDAALLVRYTDAALPLAVLGLYAGSDSRTSLGDAARTLKLLSALAPARVTRELVAMASVALDPASLNQTHQAPNALNALALLTRSLLFPIPHLASFLPTALHASLPGIDPNDVGKTVATLAFVHAVLSNVPLVDEADRAAAPAVIGNGAPAEDSAAYLSDALPSWHPASPSYPLPPAPATGLGGRVGAFGPADTQRALMLLGSGGGEGGASGGVNEGSPLPPSEDMDVDSGEGKGAASTAPRVSSAVLELFHSARDAQPAMAEWSLLFLDRVFRLLEAREKPAKANSSPGYRREEALTGWLSWCSQQLFAQMSPTLRASATDRVLQWVEGVTCLDSVKDVAHLLGAVTAVSPELMMKKFVPVHVARACASDVSVSSLRWHLLLLQAVVHAAGVGCLDLRPSLDGLRAAIRAGFASDDKPVRKAAGKLLRWVLNSCLETHGASSAASHNDADMRAPGTLWMKWANPVALVDAPLLSSVGGAVLGALPLPPAVDIAWHSPSASERADALALVNEFLVAPMLRVKKLMAEQQAAVASGGARVGAASLLVPVVVPVGAAAGAGLRLPSALSSGSEEAAGVAAAAAAVLVDAAVAGVGGRPPTPSSPLSTSSSTANGRPMTPSPTAAAAAASTAPALSAGALDKARVDLELLLAGVRGAIFALTDGASPLGDDDVVASCTGGQALVWDAAASTAKYAAAADSSAALPLPSLRHVLVGVIGAYGVLVHGHPDLTRDTKAISLLCKLSHRLVTGRGPRLSKAAGALNNCRALKRVEVNVFTHARVRQLVKACSIAPRGVGGGGRALPATTAAGLSSLTSRSLALARLRIHFNRRVAECIYAVPRALHWGRSSSAIGDGQTEDEPVELGGPGDPSLGTPGTPAAGDGGAAMSFLSASGGGPAGAPINGAYDFNLDGDDADTDVNMLKPEFSPFPEATPAPGDGSVATPPRPSSPQSSAVLSIVETQLRPAIPVFGRRALSHLAPSEHPYALLLASLAMLALHPYDLSRRKAGSYFATLVGVFSWLRRPAQIAALRRLEGFETSASESVLAAKAASLRAAAESYLSAHPVPPSPSLAHLPPLPLPPSIAAAVGISAVPGAGAGGLTLHATAGAAAAVRRHLANLDVTDLTQASRSSASDTPSSIASFDLTLSPAGGAATGPGGRPRPSPSSSSAARGGGAPTQLQYNEVLGNMSMAFGLSPGHVIMSDWQMLERGVRVLLRSASMMRALPIERQATVLQSVTVTAFNLLAHWHAIPIPAAHHLAGKWTDTRDRLLRFLLTSACPAVTAVQQQQQAAAPSAGSTGGDSDMTMGGGTRAASPALQLMLPPSAAVRAGGPLARQATNADGSRSESAAPLPASPLHWRFELLATAFMGIMMAPPMPPPSRFAMDAALPAGALAAVPWGLCCTLTEALLPPEDVWLWALSSVLSDYIAVRALAVELLIALLHGRRDVCAGAKRSPSVASTRPPPPPLPRVTALLRDPVYVSQFVMALSSDHAEARGGEEEAARVFECTVAFVEFARQHMRGGAVPSIHHMILFELLAGEFPECVSPILSALRELVVAATATTAASAIGIIAAAGIAAVGAAASAVVATAMDLINGDGAAEGAATAAAAAAAPARPSTPAPGGSSTSSSSLTGPGHDLATLRIRQATVAEALGGFMRAFATERWRHSSSSDGDDSAAALGHVDYTLADVSVAAQRAALQKNSTGSGNKNSSGGAAYSRMLDVLDVAAPIMESVGMDWYSDWYNAIRFACRQTHPARLAPLLKYLFAHTAASLAASADEPAPPSVGLVAADFDALVSAAATTGSSSSGGKSDPPTAGAAAAAPASYSYASQFRWLHLSGAAMDEMLITSDGPTGLSGSLPGVSHEEEEAIGCSGVQPPATRAAAAASTRVPANIAAMTLYRRLLPSLLRNLTHRYQPCREAVAAVLAELLEYAWTAEDAGAPVCPVPLPEVEVGPGGARAAAAACLAPPASVSRYAWAPETVAAITLVARAALRQSAEQAAAIAVAAAAAPTAPSDGAAAPPAAAAISAGGGSGSPDATWGKRALETVLSFIVSIARGDSVAVLPVLLPLLPVLLRAQNHPDRELSELASTVLVNVAQDVSFSRADERDTRVDIAFMARVTELTGGSSSSHSSSPLEFLLASLEEMSTIGLEARKALDAAPSTKVEVGGPPPAPSAASAAAAAQAQQAAWYVRRAVMAFVVPVRAHALMLLSRAEDAALQGLVQRRVEDPQVEVQVAAADTLVGFALTLPVATQAALADAFIALSATKLPKRVAPPVNFSTATPEDVEAYKKYKSLLARRVAKRHAGVLGAGAVVNAHPFDCPAFLPAVLSAIARHVTDPSPVAATTRKIVQGFKHTHTDNWESHALAFTAEQLADLSEAHTVSANYYA